MSQSRISSTTAQSILNDLACAPRIEDCGAIAARFVYSLRLIALHERAKRDPVPELATRLGSVEAAARALALSQAMAASWPESILVSRFCCRLMTHDEATIGAMLDNATNYDLAGFEREIEGLVSPVKVHDLWGACLGLVEAESRAPGI